MSESEKNEDKFHKLANLLPFHSDDELEQLAKDINNNGLLEPILVQKSSGLIVDGRNRFLACKMAGLDLDENSEEHFKVEDLDEAEIQSRLFSGLHRRSLDKSQMALVVAGLAQRKKGQRKSIHNINNETIKELSTRYLISESLIKKAKTVLDKGVSELVEQVKIGEIKVGVASEVAKHSEKEQYKFVIKFIWLNCLES